MKGITLITCFLYLSLLPACSQQEAFKQRAEKLGLAFVADVPLTGGSTRFDYQSIDQYNRRLYIAHMGSDMITVVDIDTEKVIKNIPGTPDVHGVLAVPELQRVYATASGKDQVVVIDENSLQKIAHILVAVDCLRFREDR